ncbi:MAG TPA: hypothetical protein VER55_10295, partial [Ardenticatenaceae bacterium]|nr:hypothetical protein [Ardenticatenaceae bacterium]
VRPFTASRALGAVLVQAATETQAAAVSLLVEEEPDNRRELFGALTEAYEAEDYEFLAAGTWEGTTYAGVLYHQAYIFSTLEEQSFNRRVANQILRSFGTMRMLYPDATELQNVLEWTDSDREQYLLLHSLPASVFDEWVAGRLTAEDLLSRAQLFIYDSDWNVVRGGKDFIVKSFTPPEDATGVDAPRSVTATLTEEEWGEQHTAGVFRVAVGGSADSFEIAELTGSATGFVLYDNSAVAAPLVTWHEGDDESDLSALRLAEGQYILAVEGGPAPASVTLNYVEHQSR